MTLFKSRLGSTIPFCSTLWVRLSHLVKGYKANLGSVSLSFTSSSPKKSKLQQVIRSQLSLQRLRLTQMILQLLMTSPTSSIPGEPLGSSSSQKHTSWTRDLQSCTSARIKVTKCMLWIRMILRCRGFNHLKKLMLFIRYSPLIGGSHIWCLSTGEIEYLLWGKIGMGKLALE